MRLTELIDFFTIEEEEEEEAYDCGNKYSL